MLAWSPLLASSLTVAAIAVLLAASLHDIMARTVPNWMAVVLALLGIGLRGLAGNLPTGLLAGFLVFVAAAIAWRRGWMGGGDVKLIGAAALVMPPHDVLNFIVAVTLSGGVLAVFYLLARRFVPATRALSRPRTLLARALRAECWRIRRGGPLPYACAIAIGGLFILL
ncbi:MAG TPA: prepilin peptidase [Acetobacteraceae bacterium]|jgi:prepilin peptidase CpaA